MSKNDEQLVGLIKDVVSGNQDKEVFCKEFYKEVYALVYPVFGDNSKKVTSRAFIYLCDNLDKIDVDKNIHRQVATLVSAFMFGLIDKNTIKNNATRLEYEFNKIKEDTELYNVIRDNVKMFRNPADYDNVSDSIRNLSRVQTILLELYGYEMHSIDEIEELLDMDSAFICEFLAKTRAQILDIEFETEEKSEYDEEDDSDDGYEADRYESEDETESDVLDYVAEDDSEAEDDEKSYFEDDNINDDDSDEHPFRRTKSERNAAMRRADASNPIVRKLAGVVGKLFPSLSLAARRMVVYVTGGVILLAIVLSVFLSAVLSGDSKSTAKKNNNSNNTKVTTAETATSKEKTTQARTTKKAADTTAADNAAVEETTKADKTTEENTKSTTKAAVKEAQEETVEDSENGKEEKETEASTEQETTKETESSTEENQTIKETETNTTKSSEETTEATKASEATTKETEATKAVDNTTAAADVNADNNQVSQG